MLRLRPYKGCDAKYIVGWIKDEVSLRKWSSDRYGAYPITEADVNHKYLDLNGDCEEEDNFYPVTAFDESGVVGHMIMRFTDAEKRCCALDLSSWMTPSEAWDTERKCCSWL